MGKIIDETIKITEEVDFERWLESSEFDIKLTGDNHNGYTAELLGCVGVDYSVPYTSLAEYSKEEAINDLKKKMSGQEYRVTNDSFLGAFKLYPKQIFPVFKEDS